jgi:hypothetical protein
VPCCVQVGTHTRLNVVVSPDALLAPEPPHASITPQPTVTASCISQPTHKPPDPPQPAASPLTPQPCDEPTHTPNGAPTLPTHEPTHLADEPHCQARSSCGTRLASVSPGSLVRVTGIAQRSARGGLILTACDADVELLGAAAPAHTPPPVAAPLPPRFHLTPNTVGWQRALLRMGCGAYNTLTWRGGDPLPVPPTRACWLLPASDVAALALAQQQTELRAAGWRLLTCDPTMLCALSNKLRFREHAARRGLLQYLPRHYDTPHEASYPCVIKAAVGEYGRHVHIVPSREEAVQRWRVAHASSHTRRSGGAEPDGEGAAADELEDGWLLQELVVGCVEHSASLLVVRGEIVGAVVTEYTYAEVRCTTRQGRVIGVVALLHHPRAWQLGMSVTCLWLTGDGGDVAHG